VDGERRVRYLSLGRRVVCYDYTVRTSWQPWMAGQATPSDMPVAVLAGMADHAQCKTDDAARKLAAQLNACARSAGRLHEGGKAVCP
jgi:hypothetical protein